MRGEWKILWSEPNDTIPKHTTSMLSIEILWKYILFDGIVARMWQTNICDSIQFSGQEKNRLRIGHGEPILAFF